MTDNVTALHSSTGSFLCTVSFYRKPDGEIAAVLEEMPDHVIETKQTITERFFAAASWCANGSLDLMRQGVKFDEETRSTQGTSP